MRFIFDKPLSGKENMEKDIFHYQLAQSFDNKDFILRIYQWKNPTISLGFSQKKIILNDKAFGEVEIVKRMTGGRAVLHHNEITYSLAARIDNIYFGGSLHETYRKISNVMMIFLNQIGVEAVLKKQKLKKTSSACCYDASSFFEIEVDKNKLIGSAQKRGDKAFLQHGSIPYQKTTIHLKNYLKKEYQPIQQQKVFLNNFLNQKYSLEELILLLRAKFYSLSVVS